MSRRLTFVVAIACALQVHTAAAQEVSGVLTGTVEDGQGGALVRAEVRISSPALIGRPQTSTTNEWGQVRFPALPPGPYVLEVKAQGFQSYHEDGIRVGVGATIERRVRLTLASLNESVVRGRTADP